MAARINPAKGRPREAYERHGKSTTPENQTWRDMKKRCDNSRRRDHAFYGQRGISVCDRWRHSFTAFLEDMGPRPGPGYSIDRIDSNGNYEPGNCRWATQQEQTKNRRSTIWVEHDGRRFTLKDYCKEVGLPYPTVIYRRTKMGWSLNRSIGRGD